MHAVVATKKSSALSLLRPQAELLVWAQMNLDRTVFLTRMAMAMEIEDPVATATVDHLVQDRREGMMIGEDHRRHRFQEAENRHGVKVLDRRHRMVIHFLSALTASLPGQIPDQMPGQIRRAAAPLLLWQQAGPTSTHIYHLTKADKDTTTIGHLHLATAIETATCTIGADGETVVIQIARDTMIRTPLYHVSTVMQTRRVVDRDLLAIHIGIAGIPAMRQGGLGVEVRTANDARDCRIESVISIADDCASSSTIPPRDPQCLDAIRRRRG